MHARHGILTQRICIAEPIEPRGHNGAVLLRCVVDRDGVPTRLEIIKPLDAELDRVSLEAMKQWRFEPGQKDGKAVLVQIDVMMAFSMKQEQSLWRRRP